MMIMFIFLKSVPLLQPSSPMVTTAMVMIMSSPTDRKVFEIAVRTTPFLLPACLWRKTNPSTPLSTLPWLHSLHQPILLPCLPITTSAMWTTLHLRHLRHLLSWIIPIFILYNLLLLGVVMPLVSLSSHYSLILFPENVLVFLKNAFCIHYWLIE